jgi:hypothetical protein
MGSVSPVVRLLDAVLMLQKSGLFALYQVSSLGHVPRSRMLDLRERLRVYPRHRARSDGQQVVSRGERTLVRELVVRKR